MALRRKDATVKRLGVGLALLLCALAVHAGSWTFDKGFTLTSQTTNNVGLNTVDRESDTVILARPSISARRQGGRATARFIYAPRLRYYVGGTQDNRVDHTLRATGDVELVRDIFFLRASARATQSLIDPATGAGFDNVSNPDAFTQNFTFTLTPDIRFPLRAREYATVRIRPGINFVYTADSAGTQDGLNRRGRTTRIDIRSGRFFTRMPWSINYSNDVFDADTDDGIGRVSATLGYRLSERYRFDFTFGYDRGRYDTDGDSSGIRWRGTFHWRPSRRTSFTLGFGEAFFGDDWTFNARHRHKHSVFTASYSVNVEDAAQTILGQETIVVTDPFGNEITDPVTGEPILFVVGTPILTDDVFINQRFRAGWAWSRGRTNVKLDARVDWRDYQTTDLDTLDGIVDLNLGRRVTRRTSGNLVLRYWDHSEDNPDAQDFYEIGAQLRMNYRLGERASMNLGYTYTDRNSSIPAQDFDEGRVTLGLAFRL